MPLQEICEKKIRQVGGGYGTIPISSAAKLSYQFIRELGEHRVLYTRPRYDGEAMDHIIGTIYVMERGDYALGTDCVVTHYTENDIITLIGISFCSSPAFSDRYDDDLKLVLSELRNIHPVDLGCFPYYEHKGF